MTTNYLTRLQQARKAFLNADPKNQDEVKQTYALYVQAKQNYQNSKG